MASLVLQLVSGQTDARTRVILRSLSQASGEDVSFHDVVLDTPERLIATHRLWKTWAKFRRPVQRRRVNSWRRLRRRTEDTPVLAFL